MVSERKDNKKILKKAKKHKKSDNYVRGGEEFGVSRNNSTLQTEKAFLSPLTSHLSPLKSPLTTYPSPLTSNY